MFNPKYRIMLESSCFSQNEVVGLGVQLISIINLIQYYLLPHVWYVADVQAVIKNKAKPRFNTIYLRIAGCDLQLIDYCSEVEQFIWGVFLAVDKRFLSQGIQDITLETEDQAFRSINVRGVLIEIRAFDTAFFEIYAEDFDLIEKIAAIYNVQIQKRQ